MAVSTTSSSSGGGSGNDNKVGIMTSSGIGSSSNSSTMQRTALVFGASGEQGRAVVEGLQDCGLYTTVYAFTREKHDLYITDGLNAILISGDIQNADHIRKAILETQAQCIFLVTTTELPTEIGITTGFADAADNEFQVMMLFFQILKECYEIDQLSRHIIFSVRDNVQDVTMKAYEESGDIWIKPLDDGSVVPHYSAKGKGGEYAMDYLKDIPELKLTLITIPFLYSNFLGFFTPLPDERRTQWMLTACFGDGRNKIDMMSASDLAYIVPNIFADPEKYDGRNLRLAAEQISMEEVAAAFSDLFGKDVIYNPLTVEEVACLPFATAPCMAQMCQFLGDPRSLRHNIEETIEVCFPKKPQVFKDWLLTHSGVTAFERVGLDLDAPEIIKVTVFGATSPEGSSVVKGLLADTRKEYLIRATSRHVDSAKAKAIQELDPKRIELVYANLDDLFSCQKAVEGFDGVFLVTDFYEDAGRDMEMEEQHAKNVIDACEASPTVKHLVFSTKESSDEMNKIMNLGLDKVKDATGKVGTVVQFDAKARAAAYARTKKLSVTYVLMPCYSEMFFDMIERRSVEGQPDKLVLTVPLKNKDQKVMCISVDDLGPAVANIFDSYQVYAGHEVGLVTSFVSVSEVRDIIEEVFLQDENSEVVLETAEDVTSPEQPQQWVEAKETYMKDLGQMFAYVSHTDAVKHRHAIAKTMKLIPSAKPLRAWVEQNVDNAAFREKLGLR